MPEKLIPVAGYLVVRLLPSEERAGSIFIPETAEARNVTRATRGTVVALGQGVVEKLNGGDAYVHGLKEKVPVEVGSVIEFEMFAGNSYDDDQKRQRLKVLSWGDVRAVVVQE